MDVNKEGKKRSKVSASTTSIKMTAAAKDSMKSADIPSLRKEDNETFNTLLVGYSELEQFFTTATREMISNNILDLLACTALENLNTRTSIKGDKEKLGFLQSHFLDA